MRNLNVRFFDTVDGVYLKDAYTIENFMIDTNGCVVDTHDGQMIEIEDVEAHVFNEYDELVGII